MDYGLFPPGQSHAAAADVRSQSSDDMAFSRELTSQYNQQTTGLSCAEKPDRNSADRFAIALLCVLSNTGSTSPSLAQTLKAPPHGRTSTTLNPINHQMTARGPALSSVLSPFFSFNGTIISSSFCFFSFSFFYCCCDCCYSPLKLLRPLS